MATKFHKFMLVVCLALVLSVQAANVAWTTDKQQAVSVTRETESPKTGMTG
jgi:hypothetical protein